MGNVVKLAADNAHKGNKLCATCRFYHPDTTLGWASMKFLWWGKSVPSAAAYRFATCAAYGGHFAATARNTCQGNDWERAE